jgi:hypothetical protein
LACADVLLLLKLVLQEVTLASFDALPAAAAAAAAAAMPLTSSARHVKQQVQGRRRTRHLGRAPPWLVAGAHNVY